MRVSIEARRVASCLCNWCNRVAEYVALEVNGQLYHPGCAVKLLANLVRVLSMSARGFNDCHSQDYFSHGNGD